MAHIMDVWLLRDPHSERIALQVNEPGEGTFPPGAKGRGWQIRRGVIEEQLFEDLMAAKLTGDEQDDLHLSLWDEGTQP